MASSRSPRKMEGSVGTPRATGALHARVEEAISQIRPAIRDDGGDVEVVDVSPAGRVTLRFKGACMACPSRDMTLQSGIERHLKAHVPEITDVIEG